MIDRKELVEKMICASANALGIKAYDHQMVTTGMDAALSVAVGELLKEPTPDERARFRVDIVRNNEGLGFLGDVPLANFIGTRRAKLERVKTPREQIEAVIDKHRAQINNGRTPMDDMVIELTGLIQQLKGSA